MFRCLLLILAGLLWATAAPAKPHDYLRDCWRQQGQPLRGNSLVLSYQKTVNEREYSSAPWQATAYTGRGRVWLTADNFLKQDTLTNVAQQRTYYSSTQRSATGLLYREGIPQQGPVRKASAWQAGLYQAIKDLKLDVETIVQLWPVAGASVKTIIPFADLEQSVK